MSIGDPIATRPSREELRRQGRIDKMGAALEAGGRVANTLRLFSHVVKDPDFRRTLAEALDEWGRSALALRQLIEEEERALGSDAGFCRGCGRPIRAGYSWNGFCAHCAQPALTPKEDR